MEDSKNKTTCIYCNKNRIEGYLVPEYEHIGKHGYFSTRKANWCTKCTPTFQTVRQDYLKILTDSKCNDLDDIDLDDISLKKIWNQEFHRKIVFLKLQQLINKLKIKN